MIADFGQVFLSELALVLIQLEIDPSGLIIKLHYKSLRGVLLLNLIILMDLNCLNSLGQLKLGREIDPKVIQAKKSLGDLNLGTYRSFIFTECIINQVHILGFINCVFHHWVDFTFGQIASYKRKGITII